MDIALLIMHGVFWAAKNNLKLEDVAREACIYPDNSHNAFADS